MSTYPDRGIPQLEALAAAVRDDTYLQDPPPAIQVENSRTNSVPEMHHEQTQSMPDITYPELSDSAPSRSIVEHITLAGNMTREESEYLQPITPTLGPRMPPLQQQGHSPATKSSWQVHNSIPSDHRGNSLSSWQSINDDNNQTSPTQSTSKTRQNMSGREKDNHRASQVLSATPSSRTHVQTQPLSNQSTQAKPPVGGGNQRNSQNRTPISEQSSTTKAYNNTSPYIQSHSQSRSFDHGTYNTPADLSGISTYNTYLQSYVDSSDDKSNTRIAYQPYTDREAASTAYAPMESYSHQTGTTAVLNKPPTHGASYKAPASKSGTRSQWNTTDDHNAHNRDEKIASNVAGPYPAVATSERTNSRQSYDGRLSTQPATSNYKPAQQLNYNSSYTSQTTPQARQSQNQQPNWYGYGPSESMFGSTSTASTQKDAEGHQYQQQGDNSIDHHHGYHPSW
jgi:hypothetical protein